LAWEVLVRVASTSDVEADPHVQELRRDFEIEVASSGDDIVELNLG
jgi:hypothetical protein